jgi:REP element-mobilizing transposase RayT
VATHKQHLEPTTYFVTFTCYKWLPLFELCNSYSSVYNWFEIIKAKGADVIGYVIMPNHVHCLIHINNSTTSLNKLVANGKRFMAYEIVKILKENDRIDILGLLEEGVQKKELVKGKKHQVFKASFDARPCFDESMLEQKLDYIHANPVSGKWSLVDDFVDYKHSSAGFYEKDEKPFFEVIHYKDIS